jgi:hypothetical protein
MMNQTIEAINNLLFNPNEMMKRRLQNSPNKLIEIYKVLLDPKYKTMFERIISG